MSTSAASLLRQRNSLVLQEYRELVGKNILLLAQCNNLSTVELAALRKKLSAGGVQLRLLKTSLFRHTLPQDSGLKSTLSGPLMALASDREAGEVGTVLAGVMKDSPRVHLLAGRVGGQEWTREGCVDVMSKLPTLLSAQQQLLSLLQTPAQSLLSTLQHSPTRLLTLLNSKGGEVSKEDLKEKDLKDQL